MSPARALVDQCERLGVKLIVIGERLRVTPPPAGISEEFRDELGRYRDEIVREIDSPPANGGDVPSPLPAPHIIQSMLSLPHQIAPQMLVNRGNND